MRYERTGERTARLEIRLRPDERAEIDSVAEDADAMSASDWARRLILAEVRRFRRKTQRPEKK